MLSGNGIAIAKSATWACAPSKITSSSVLKSTAVTKGKKKQILEREGPPLQRGKQLMHKNTDPM